MDRVLISSLVGFVTYMVLNVYQPENKVEQSGGAKKKAEKVEKEKKEEKFDEQYPLCYEICPIAKKVYNELKKDGKEETIEFKDLNRLYSRIFCFEMALGNNKDDKVEENKVNKELERYKSYYNMEDDGNVSKFINDTFNKSEKLLKKLSTNDSLIMKNKEMYDMHNESIMKLLKKFLKK